MPIHEKPIIEMMSELKLNHELENRTILITGCSGFVGRNLLSFLTELQVFKNGNLIIYCVSRLGNDIPVGISNLPNINFLRWDVRYPLGIDLPNIDFIFHLAGATERIKSITGDPDVFNKNIVGTLNVLALARRSPSTKILLASSGSVYDLKVAGNKKVDEDSATRSEDGNHSSTYHQSKIKAEQILLEAHKLGANQVVVARMFAFVGPFMAPSSQYAAANFIGDCLAGLPIRITSDGKAVRSYQYSIEMARWLVHLMLFASSGSIFNVGSDEAVAINQLAEIVGRVCKNTKGLEMNCSSLTESTFYVPCIDKAKSELGLTNEIQLQEAILKTFEHKESFLDIQN